MAPVGITLAVPRELAINTNHPNVSQIVLSADLAESHVRRSARQQKAINKNIDRKEIAPEQPAGHVALEMVTPSINAKSHKRQSRAYQCQEKSKLSTHDIEAGPEQPCSKRKCDPEVLTQIVESRLRFTTSPSIQPSDFVAKSAKTFTTKQLNTPGISDRRITVPLSKQEEKKLTKQDRVTNTTLKPKSEMATSPPPFESNEDTSTNLSSSTSSSTSIENILSPPPSASQSIRPVATRIPNRRLSARNANTSAERLAFERDLRHDAYGTVRFEPYDTAIPANADDQVKWMQRAMEIPTLKRTMEEARAQRRQKNESEKKLWDLSKQMPWVLDHFNTFEEYESWRMGDDKRRAKYVDSESGNENETDDYSRQTTEEDLSTESLLHRSSHTTPATHMISSQTRLEDLESERPNEAGTNRAVLMYGSPKAAKLSLLADVCSQFGKPEH